MIQGYRRVLGDELEEGIVGALLENRLRRLSGVHPQALVQRLPITAPPHTLHQNHLRRHQR